MGFVRRKVDIMMIFIEAAKKGRREWLPGWGWQVFSTPTAEIRDAVRMAVRGSFTVRDECSPPRWHRDVTIPVAPCRARRLMHCPRCGGDVEVREGLTEGQARQHHNIRCFRRSVA